MLHHTTWYVPVVFNHHHLVIPHLLCSCASVTCGCFSTTRTDSANGTPPGWGLHVRNERHGNVLYVTGTDRDLSSLRGDALAALERFIVSLQVAFMHVARE